MTAEIVVRDGSNVSRTITDIVVRDASNTPRTISEVRVRDVENVSRVVFGAGSGFGVTVNPTTRAARSYGTGTATTQSVNATATGGSSPYTYAWALLSYTSPTPPVANSPTSASTTFTLNNIDTGAFYTSTWRVTATDSGAATSSTTATVNFSDVQI